MKRNVKKMINEYESLYDTNKKAFAFYPKEIKALEDISSDKFDFVINTLKYGFMCGYHARKEKL